MSKPFLARSWRFLALLLWASQILMPPAHANEKEQAEIRRFLSDFIAAFVRSGQRHYPRQAARGVIFGEKSQAWLSRGC